MSTKIIKNDISLRGLKWNCKCINIDSFKCPLVISSLDSQVQFERIFQVSIGWGSEKVGWESKRSHMEYCETNLDGMAKQNLVVKNNFGQGCGARIMYVKSLGSESCRPDSHL